MKINEDNIQIETNNHGEIKSIKFFDIEILHDGSKDWLKTYPIIWPVTSFSRSFEVNSRNYEIPKHGFWKNLNWETIIENNSIVMLATHIADDIYPFSIDIEFKITIINKNQIKQEFTFSNLGNDNAYFAFGLHPAFVIDKSSVINYLEDENVLAIDFDGSHKNTNTIFKNAKITEMPFGKEYDTLTVIDCKSRKVKLVNEKYNVTIFFDSKHIQIWRPEFADFVCIEPWYSWNDDAYEAPRQAKDKKDIISLSSGERKKFVNIIELNLNN